MSQKFSKAAEDRVAELKKLYPDPKSVVMPALYIAQEEVGYVNDQAIEWVAGLTGISPVQVREVATFYTMYYQKPVGKYHVQVCRTLSCALCGAKKLMEYMHQRWGILPGQVTSDGMWSYEAVECLGSCGTGPMCEINDCYFENLDVKQFGELIDRIEREKPDLRYSTLKGKLGEGLKGYPKSQII